jgi:hypothetical protein
MFPYRFNIAADLVDQVRDGGMLGIVGVFVWIRFMATRQLIWNKNYNVNHRYAPVSYYLLQINIQPCML